MKKKVLLILLLVFIGKDVYASEKTVVKLSKCVDGDTANFEVNSEIKKARFLAINTPESVDPRKKVEPYGKEASSYTCEKLTKAKKIEIEYDPNSDKTDKYGRILVWVYVDDKLLQEDLVSNGFAEVKYLYGDYLYNNMLKEKEQKAKEAKLRIWSDEALKEKEDMEKSNNDSSKDKLDEEKKEWFLDYIEKILNKITRKIVKKLESML